MKIGPLKEYRSGTAESYLSVDLARALREIRTVLDNLTFADNFDSFIVTVEIPSGEEIKIRNQLQNKIPRYRIILRGDEGSKDVVDGDTEWNPNNVYLKNVGASAANLTVLFLA